MGDQGRWFKLWHSALSDDALQALSPSLRWAWVALGCHTKVHGTDGQVQVAKANIVLAAQMGVPVEALLDTIRGLPHVHVTVHNTVDVEEGTTRDGTFTVTWQNWHKYQVDSTGAARMRALRSKRRRDKEEMRREKTPPPTPSGGRPDVLSNTRIGSDGQVGPSPPPGEPERVRDILARWQRRGHGEAPF